MSFFWPRVVERCILVRGMVCWNSSNRTRRFVRLISSLSFPSFVLASSTDRLMVYSAADFILDQISIDHRSKSAEDTSTEKVARFVSSWERTESSTSVKSSPHHLGIESAKKLALSDPTSTKNDSPESSTKRASAPFHIALPVLVGRSFKNLRRQQDAALARIINPPFLALLFFLFFGRLDLAASTAQTRIGILQETTALPFVGMLACLSIFPVERNLFLHEHKSASSRQSVFTFLLAYTLQEILVSIISSGLFSLVVVFGIRLQNSPRIFIEFWVSSFALINLGESIGIFFCAFVDNGGLAVSLVSVGITILSQLNGIISVTLPTWLEYLGWASPLKLQARIQIINEFTGLVFDCSDAQIASGACIARQSLPLILLSFLRAFFSKLTPILAQKRASSCWRRSTSPGESALREDT